MVSVSQHAQHGLIVASPNCSASWRHNQLLLALIGTWTGLIALAFAALGAWPVLPFAGIEILALGAALYYSCWKQNHRHVLRIERERLTLEKGVYYPRQTWRFPRAESRIAVRRPGHGWEAPQLTLCCAEDRVPIGDFLNREDCQALLAGLRQQGLAVQEVGRDLR